jgi:hypothetical protein
MEFHDRPSLRGFLMNPEQFILHRTQWQFFVTLTFKDEKVAERRGVRLVFAYLRRAAKWFRVYFPRLRWVARLEAGELNGRLHYHVLIAGLPERAVQSRTCHALVALWEKRWRLGLADARLWEKGRDAVSYITKGASDFSLVGANQYEASKFGSRCAVITSECLLNTVSALKDGGGRSSRSKSKGLNSVGSVPEHARPLRVWVAPTGKPGRKGGAASKGAEDQGKGYSPDNPESGTKPGYQTRSSGLSAEQSESCGC